MRPRRWRRPREGSVAPTGRSGHPRAQRNSVSARAARALDGVGFCRCARSHLPDGAYDHVGEPPPPRPRRSPLLAPQVHDADAVENRCRPEVHEARGEGVRHQAARYVNPRLCRVARERAGDCECAHVTCQHRPCPPCGPRGRCKGARASSGGPPALAHAWAPPRALPGARPYLVQAPVCIVNRVPQRGALRATEGAHQVVRHAPGQVQPHGGEQQHQREWHARLRFAPAPSAAAGRRRRGAAGQRRTSSAPQRTRWLSRGALASAPDRPCRAPPGSTTARSMARRTWWPR